MLVFGLVAEIALGEDIQQPGELRLLIIIPHPQSRKESSRPADLLDERCGIGESHIDEHSGKHTDHDGIFEGLPLCSGIGLLRHHLEIRDSLLRPIVEQPEIFEPGELEVRGLRYLIVGAFDALLLEIVGISAFQFAGELPGIF